MINVIAVRGSDVFCFSINVTSTRLMKSQGAMRLRTRGHDFTPPFVKYNFNKKNFIVRALYNYI